jgi:WXXGXW repeat (2 copies)
MSRRYLATVALPAIVALGIAAAMPAHAQPSTVIIAPSAPPPPPAETIPPPPDADAQMMTWHAGRWMWTGSNWNWEPGHYVQRPAPAAVWEPGHWMQESNGGYVWVDGHWQS